jgi:hypothetical protein
MIAAPIRIGLKGIHFVARSVKKTGGILTIIMPKGDDAAIRKADCSAKE